MRATMTLWNSLDYLRRYTPRHGTKFCYRGVMFTWAAHHAFVAMFSATHKSVSAQFSH